MTDTNTVPTAPEIAELVNRFYAAVRADPTLAPTFGSRVSDWPAHQLKMMGFWRSVLLGTKVYKGHLMALHARLPGLAPEHFSHWLALFDQTLRETLPPASRAYTEYIARRFARALQLGLFGNAMQQRDQSPLFDPTANGQKVVPPC